ncbi:hypothetical protein [Celeribacter marinus]|uniref:hypothetical protein n=1 Tax=Celeribacter marinus TaxID=1397108 RepID=UPI003F6D6333
MTSDREKDKTRMQPQNGHPTKGQTDDGADSNDSGDGGDGSGLSDDDLDGMTNWGSTWGHGRAKDD